MKKVFFPFIVRVLAALSFAAPAPCRDDWLKKAKLGPYGTAAFDEKQLYERAQQEKEVTIYSYSSWVHQFVKTLRQL